MYRSIKIVLIYIIVLLITLSGCSFRATPEHLMPIPNEEERDELDTTEQPTRGGRLNIAIPEPDTFNPLFTISKDIISFLGLIYEGLIKYDEHLMPQPALAESWEVSQEGRLWFFTLKKGVKWHNGEPLTGHDVIFTIKALQQGNFNSFYHGNKAVWTYIEDIGLKDGDIFTVYIKLRKPVGDLLDILTLPILPLNGYQSADFMLSHKGDMELLPIGTGPYKVDLERYKQGQEILLVKNKDWWGNEPYIDSILAKIYPSNGTEINALQDGEVDVINTTAIYASAYLDSDDVNLYKYMTQSYDFIGFNFENPILEDLNVRRAIAYALDRKEIIKKVYLNNAEAVDVPLPSDSWLYDNHSRIYDFQISKAQSILDEIGWVDSDGDGIRDKIIDEQKVNLQFRLLTNEENSFRKDALVIIKEQLREAGIDIISQSVKWEEMCNNLLPNKDFDAVLTGYFLDVYPDLQFAFHSAQGRVSLEGFIGYDNMELDNLLNRAAITYDNKKLKDTYKGIQKHISSQLPVISLYFRTSTLIANKRVKGIHAPREMNIYRNIEEWYLQ